MREKAKTLKNLAVSYLNMKNLIQMKIMKAVNYAFQY